MKTRALKALLLVLSGAILLVGCGSGGQGAEPDEPDAGLTAVKSFMTERTGELAVETANLKTAGNAYFNLAKASDFNYSKLLKTNCETVNATLKNARVAYARANSNYQQVRGLVAGIPRTAQYDTDLESGTDGTDPAKAVSFNLNLGNGRVMHQPGSLFRLIEASLFGTSPDLAAPGTRPDVNCDGKVEFGEGLPEAGLFRAATGEIHRQAGDLDKDAQEIVITPSDAFTAITTMTPTIGDLFREWRLSPFVAGEGSQTGSGHVATSRLADITDILSGLQIGYREIEPLIAEKNPEQAVQIGDDLSGLLTAVGELRDREATGEKFSPLQAERFGALFQARADRIAGQAAQAARDLDIPIQDG